MIGSIRSAESAHSWSGPAGQHLCLHRLRANVEGSNDTTYGVLELSLLPDGYEWNFLPVPDGAFTDSGSDRCH